MSDTYCGKSCESCMHKESLNCSGCKDGPGKSMYGGCELAKCCKEKGHKTCDTCSYNLNCGTLRRRESIPKERLREIEAEAERRAEIAQKAPFLGKWLWLLFLLVIPSVLASFMTNDNIVSWIPALFLPGQILNILSTVAYGLILLKLSTENEHYKTAGFCGLAAAAVSAVVALISGGGEATWTFMLTLPAAVVGLVGEYHEYMGHSEILNGVDFAMSEKWGNLWKWYIGSFVAMFTSVVVVIIAQILGLLVMLAATITLLVVSLLKLVYLYQTAKLFRAY